METVDNRLTWNGLSAETLVERFGSPLYVYDERIVRRRLRELRDAFAHPRLRVFYACKANPNPAILRIIRNEGAGVDAVSPGEIMLALGAGFPPEEILFTCNSMRNEDMDFAVEKGVLVNVDSFSALRRMGERHPGNDICVRLCPNVEAGFVDKVRTGAAASKFGIHLDRIPAILEVTRQHRLRVIGLHEHTGSGVADPEDLLRSMDALLGAAPAFPDLRFLDVGGGFHVSYHQDDPPLDVKALGTSARERFMAATGRLGRDLELWLEPGKWVVAEAGVLLTRVNTVERRPDRTLVGCDVGFSQFIRPAFYGAHHEVVNASRVQGERETVDVVGNICETGDVQARAREVTRFEEGDVLAFLTAGAYCFSMASNYNERPLPAEVLINDAGPRLVRRREKIEDMLRTAFELEEGITRGTE